MKRGMCSVAIWLCVCEAKTFICTMIHTQLQTAMLGRSPTVLISQQHIGLIIRETEFSKTNFE